MPTADDSRDGHLDNAGLPAAKRAKLSTETSESLQESVSQENSVPDNFAAFDSVDLNSDALWNDITDVMNHANGDSGDVLVNVNEDAMNSQAIVDSSLTSPEETDATGIDGMNTKTNENQPRIQLASLFLSAPPSGAQRGDGDSSSGFAAHLGVDGISSSSHPPEILPCTDEAESLPHDKIGGEKTATPPKVRLANIFLSAPFSSPPRIAQPSSYPNASDPSVKVVSKPSLPTIKVDAKMADHVVNLPTAEVVDLALPRPSTKPPKPLPSTLDESVLSSLPNASVSPKNDLTPKSPGSLETPETSTAKRRETLMGIVTGIKASPLKRAEQTTVSDDILVQSAESKEVPTLLSNAETNFDVTLPEAAAPVAELSPATVQLDLNLESTSTLPSASKSKARKGQGEVAPRKRAPRKEPKPRTPLDQRVYYSRKEIEVASSFLEDKEDLCEIIPIDDCFLLAEWFWIFTVQQLERALNENPGDGTPNYVNEMIMKFSMNSNSKDAGHKSVPPEEVASNMTAIATDSSSIAATGILDYNPTFLQSDANLAGANSCDLGGANSTTLGVTLDSDMLPESLQTESGLKGASVVAIDASQVNAVHPKPDATIGQLNQNPDPDRLRVIEEKILSWRTAITEFRSIPRIKTPVQLRFNLDGPIKLLFPESTQNFFKSIELETLFSFLALRKSETGAVCDLMSIWRRECQMSTVPDLGLARHFLGIASRIEAVLSAYPPIADADRGWMLDPISGLTGAARDFLIRHQKITSAAYFLSLRTKEVANILEIWREQNGMDVLRGSGKVAMVSAWKAYIKEALEAENNVGRVIDLSNYLAKVQNEKYTAFLSTAKDSSGSGKDSNSDFALYSKHVLERALGEGATLLLKSAGIQTAAQLFAADLDPSTSSLYKVLMDTGIVGGTQAFESAVENWRKSMKEYLDKTPGLRKYQEAHQSKAETLHQPKRTTPQATKKAAVKQHESSTNPKEAKIEKLLLVNAADEDEVFNALSFTTRQFLQTVGIRTSYDFLSSRSSDLASSFVAWRRAKGKPELKGLGSIASISGWKSIIRKKAKDLGLDGLAEIEPSTRGFKLSQDQTPFPQDFNEDEGVDADDSGSVGEFPYRSNGLEVDKKILFAVQQRDEGAEGHSVFELSHRFDNTTLDKWILFVSYRGFGARKSSKDRAESILLKSTPSPSGSVDARHNWILPDVPLCGQNKNEISSCDFRSLFSSFLGGGGLIDIGCHGAFPYESQSLEPIKTLVVALIRHGHDAPTPIVDGPLAHCFNVLIRKKQLDKFQYLLFLSKPVECCQTLKVRFPSIAATIESQKFVQSEYSSMYKIEESLRTLCLGDLRTLLAWLENDVLSSLDTAASSKEKGQSFIEICVLRRRLYWIGRRVFAAIGHHRLTEDERMFEALCFCSQKYTEGKQWIDLTEEQRSELALKICTQIEVELDYVLDQDVSCGIQVRSGWNCKSQEFFEQFLSAAAKCIDRSFADEDAWMSLAAFITKFKRDLSRNSVSVPDNLNNGCVNSSDCNDNATSSMTQCEQTNTNSETPPSGDLTVGLIWQIVNSVFEAIRLDFFHLDNSDMLQNVLSSLHSIIYDEDVLVVDPQPMLYNEVLFVPSNLSCPDVECVPSTFELFLGLVWPTLRTCGWRIFVGSSAEDVSFMPKSMFRKRWEAMRRLQDRESLMLARDIKYGIHSLSKTTKRLLLSVTSESIDTSNSDTAMSMDVCYDATRSVKSVFDRCRTWLLSKFAGSDDFTQVIAKEIIGNATLALEECFDSCASMLVLIPNLLPCFDGVDDEKRPVNSYRSEYLLPFLVSLLSINELKSPTTGDSGNSMLNEDDLRAFVCDVLHYISLHYKDLFEERFHPPLEEYGVADEPGTPNSPLWIEHYLQSLKSETSAENTSLPRVGDDNMDTSGEDITAALGPTNTEGSSDELFDVILDEEKNQLTDFIRIVLENASPFYASEDDIRRKSGRALGAPGLACRHCFSKSSEGKYLFSSVESLSACYPVLEKHLYKCTFTPIETKQLIQNARTLHSEQRKEKPSGSQQAYFTQLWGRMNKGKPTAESWKKSRTTNPDTNKNGDEVESDDEVDTEINGSSPDATDLTDHLKVLDFLRKNLNKMPKNSREDIQDALDTYYSCLDYAGRVYGTSSMPPHFSSRWLLKKLTGHHERSESSNHYVG